MTRAELVERKDHKTRFQCVEIKPSATAAHLRDMAAELTKMAEGRA
jgi:hypothetical protein